MDQYKIANSEKVIYLEEALKKEIKELKHEIEEFEMSFGNLVRPMRLACAFAYCLIVFLMYGHMNNNRDYLICIAEQRKRLNNVWSKYFSTVLSNEIFKKTSKNFFL